MPRLVLAEQAEFLPDKPVHKLLYDSEKMRVVLFCLLPGQAIAPHTSASEVMMHLVEGEGAFTVGSEKHKLTPGSFLVCKSNEPHGFEATQKMMMLAIIAPRP